MDLEEKLAARGRELAAREATQADALARARALADALHGRVSLALAAYEHEIAGAPWLTVVQGVVQQDDKHLHAFEFDVRRGRHRVIVVVKSRGDVTLVGPFHMGKDEGPCRRVGFSPDDAVVAPSDDMIEAVAEVLDRFLVEAATP